MDRLDNSNTKIIYLLCSILIFSVLIFGSVEVWSFSIISSSILTIFMYKSFIKNDLPFFKKDEEGLNKKDKRLLFAILTIILYIVIQIIPFPSLMIKVISPKTYELYSYYSIEKNIFIPLSLYPYKTQLELVRVVVYIAFFLLVSFNINNIKKLDLSLKILCYFGFFLALFSILQKATFNGKIYWFRELTVGGTPFGPFVNRNHYAGLINMLIMIGLGIMFTRQKLERRLLFGFLTVIMSVSLFLSLSRAGIISYFVAITSFTFLLLKNKMKNKKILAISAFVVILCLYLIYLGIDPIIDRFYKADIDSKARFVIWADTLEAFKDFLFTGTGLGTFVYIYPLYSSRTISFICDHTHNDYLEYLVELGLIGMSILLSILFLYIKAIFPAEKSSKQKIYNYAFLSSILTIAVHSVFDFNLHIPSNALMFSAILGFAYANSRIDTNNTSQIINITN